MTPIEQQLRDAGQRRRDANPGTIAFDIERERLRELIRIADEAGVTGARIRELTGLKRVVLPSASVRLAALAAGNAIARQQAAQDALNAARRELWAVAYVEKRAGTIAEQRTAVEPTLACILGFKTRASS